MKKLLLSLGLSFISLQALDLTANDKQQHIFYSSVITLTTYETVKYFKPELNRFDRNLYTGIISSLPGIAKEVLDSKEKGNKFDEEDIIANSVGIGVTLLIRDYIENTYINVEKDRVSFKKTFTF